MMKKKPFYSMISLFFVCFFGVVFLFSSSVFAKGKCRACNKMPKDLRTYTEVMQDLIALLPITPSSSGSGNVRDAIGSAWYGREMAKIGYAFKNILTPYIPKADSVFDDIKMQYETDALRRDEAMLIDINNAISQRVIAMVEADRHNDVVPPEVWKKVDTFLKKLGYMSLKKRNGTEQYEFTGQKYRVLAHFIWKLNQMYQQMHRAKRYRYYIKNVGTGIQKTNNKDEEKAMKERENEQITLLRETLTPLLYDFFRKKEDSVQEEIDFWRYISFDEKQFTLHVWNIHDAYACAVGLDTNECDTQWQEVRKNMQYLGKKITQDSQRARVTFLDAWTRLKGLFGTKSDKAKEAMKQRQQALLHTYRGAEVPDKEAWRKIVHIDKKIDPTPWTFQAMVKDMQYAWKKMSDIVATQKKIRRIKKASKAENKSPYPDVSFDEERTKTPEQKKAVLDRIDDAIQERKKWKYQYIKEYRSQDKGRKNIIQFQSAFHDVLRLQDDMQAENVFIDVREVTKKFPALSAAVYRGVIIRGQKGDEDGLYNAMGKVCEYQCENLNNKGKRCRARK